MFEKNRSRMIVFIMLLSVFVLSDESDCKFSVGGKNYDLSGLKTKTATGDDSKFLHIITLPQCAATCQLNVKISRLVQYCRVLSTKWVESQVSNRYVGTCLRNGTAITLDPLTNLLGLTRTDSHFLFQTATLAGEVHGKQK